MHPSRPGGLDWKRSSRCPTQSVDWDATKNVIIEGENLEALKLLQKAYYGKVKMIYIDPPYNTGKEFIYPDNFSEGLGDYLRYSGQVDEEGIRLFANSRDRRPIPLKVVVNDVSAPIPFLGTYSTRVTVSSLYQSETTRCNISGLF